MTDIKIPNVGESVSEVTIASWMKKAGDSVKKDEAIVELETDKASQELVSPEDGVLEEILVAEGDVAEIGKVIAKLSSGKGDEKQDKDNAAEKGDAETKSQTETPTSDEATDAGGGGGSEGGGGGSEGGGRPGGGGGVYGLPAGTAGG